MQREMLCWWEFGMMRGGEKYVKLFFQESPKLVSQTELLQNARKDLRWSLNRMKGRINPVGLFYRPSRQMAKVQIRSQVSDIQV
mmetsp:Transcript_21479/g.36946  ORF Transcript_21479/g.36946 Transcript_21479/m.36946 type:complete len:84 (+) Transcript_21479:412-663(+)